MTKIKLGNEEISYQVFYKKNNRSMYLRVKDNIITITCPSVFSKKEIEAFILENKDKVLKSLHQNNLKKPLYSEEYLKLFGHEVEMRYTMNNTRNSYLIHEDHIEINFVKDYFDTRYIEKIYQELTLITINEILESESESLSKYFNLKNITYKSQLMKSRFGSCHATKKIIKLNSFLARLPVIYIRTILIHEIIHLRIHNHQKEFYKYINMFIPNYKQIVNSLNEEYRKYVI